MLGLGPGGHCRLPGGPRHRRRPLPPSLQRTVATMAQTALPRRRALRSRSAKKLPCSLPLPTCALKHLASRCPPPRASPCWPRPQSPPPAQSSP
eukprot:5514500-Alexandrium_andersonii.AAC.1